MYIDNILDAKTKLGISCAEIAKRSKLGLSERTIKRILNRELKTDKISNIIDIGEAVGLTEQQIFAGTTAMLTDVNVDALKADYDALLAERDEAIAKVAVLQATVDELKIKVDTLKDEIIDTHKYYIKKQTSEK
jgi:transcriptional regulator with XRE-family HTH domain